MRNADSYMKELTSKIARNIPGLLMAIPLLPLPASCTLMPSASDYQMAYSVVDNGGGERMTSAGSGEYFVEAAIGQNSMPPNLGITTGGEYSNRVGFYNPPHFIYQGGLTTALAMVYNAQLTIPANAVDKNVFDIIINDITPANPPVIADPRMISNANDKIVHNEGDWAKTFSGLKEIAIFDEQDFYTKPLASPGMLSLHYNDTGNDGIVDGSYPAVRTNSLVPWGLDESLGNWVQMHDVSVDKSMGILSFAFTMPGVYALLGELDQTLDRELKAYPVPFRPNGPHAGIGKNQTGTEASGILFEGVPQSGKIEIYTLDGRLVKKLNTADAVAAHNNMGQPTFKVKWDVKTASGERVASGVYIWRVVSGANSKFGKLMVIW